MRRLPGNDNRGVVLDAGDRIVRQVDPAFREQTVAMFRRYEREELAKLGVIETALAADNGASLSHRKLPISYSFEWPANMFKDAALFHLELMLALYERGLTLKDALPENVLFDGTRPQFVDFFSIIPFDDLDKEGWLVRERKPADVWRLVFKDMFFPHFLVPLLEMRRHPAHARRLLSERACNCTEVPPSVRDLLHDWRAALRYVSATSKIHTRDFRGYVVFLRDFIRALDVTLAASGYVDYYGAKGEDFPIDNVSAWGPKQRAVHSVLNNLRPATVLDLGANTGWFARLASSLGARVIATDVDESSIDLLYRTARDSRLPILPLRIDFDALTASPAPLFLPPIERLASDAVLCLGLLHHLVLGSDVPIERVLSTLRSLTKRTLILEFVSLDDELIRQEPRFFASLRKHSADTYNLELVLDRARAHFRRVTVMDSHPSTRKLLVIEND